MYRPSSFREYKSKEYEGTVRAPVSVDFTADGSKLFVERPIDYIMRANPDIGGQVRVVSGPKDMTLDGSFRSNGADHIINAIPFSKASDNFSFPLVRMATSCVFQPETSAQMFESNPKQLYDLARIMCDEKTLNRTSKVRREATLWQQSNGTIVKGLANMPQFDTYYWRMRDNPGGAIAFQVGQLETHVLFVDQQTMFRYTSTAGVDTAVNFMPIELGYDDESTGDVVFTTDYKKPENVAHASLRINPLLLFPHTDQADWDNTYTTGAPPAAVNVRLTEITFTVSKVSVPIDETGYATFGDGKLGYYPLELILTKIRLEQQGGPGIFDLEEAVGIHNWVETLPNTVKAPFEGGLDVFLLLPQVKFKIGLQNSIHGIGSRVLVEGVMDNRISSWVQALNTYLPEAPVAGFRASNLDVMPLALRSEYTFQRDTSVLRRYREFWKNYYPHNTAPDQQVFSLYRWGADRVLAPTPIIHDHVIVPANLVYTQQVGGTPIHLMTYTDAASGHFTAEDEGHHNGIVRTWSGNPVVVDYTVVEGTAVTVGANAQMRMFTTKVDVAAVIALRAEMAAANGHATTDRDNAQAAWQATLSEAAYTAYQIHERVLTACVNSIGFGFEDPHWFHEGGDPLTVPQKANHWWLHTVAANGQMRLMPPTGTTFTNVFVAGVAAAEGAILLVMRVNSYLQEENGWLSAYHATWGDNDGDGISTLKLFEDILRATPVAEHDLNLQSGDRFAIVNYTPEWRDILALNAAPPPVGAGDFERNYVIANEDLVGDRRIGGVLAVQDPIICGPISPFGYVDTLRPIDSGTPMLPPRLNNFELQYNLNASTQLTDASGTAYTATQEAGTQLQLLAEYLPFNEDEIEKSFMYCPFFVTKSFANPVVGEIHEMTFINGPPNWLYVRHDPVHLEKFRFLYRGKPSDILGRAGPFGHFKMMNRSVHPRSSLTFRDWDTSDRGFLIRLEELGIWATGLKEWQDRCQLQIELLETTGAIEKLDVIGVYEHYALRDRHDHSDFVFM